jgi:hypothetical protein
MRIFANRCQGKSECSSDTVLKFWCEIFTLAPLVPAFLSTKWHGFKSNVNGNLFSVVANT